MEASYSDSWKRGPLADDRKLTNTEEVLRRQVVASWTKDGNPLSVAFRPTPKDKRRLSTDQESVTPKESFDGYESRTGTRPHSTWGISVGVILGAHECLSDEVKEVGRLDVIDDGGTEGLHDTHASVVYSKDYDGASSSRTQKYDERIARELKKEAINRGRLHPPV